MHPGVKKGKEREKMCILPLGSSVRSGAAEEKEKTVLRVRHAVLQEREHSHLMMPYKPGFVSISFALASFGRTGLAHSDDINGAKDDLPSRALKGPE